MRYFDSHAHYYDDRFAEECEESVDKLIDALLSDNISGIVNVGTSPETCALAIEQASRHEGMYTALGIHPSDTRFLSDPEAELEKIKKMILDPTSKCVALGEIGLDYHYEGYNKTLQSECFDAQMCMAKEKKLPVIIHDREAHGDCFDIVISHPDVTGVFHSYSGSAEMARDLVRRGWYISFSGVATFKNAPKVREAIAAVPLERILIETDAPYLAPHPYRGRINNSALMKYTAEAVAEVKGISTEEIIEITCNNAINLFLKKD